MRQTFFYDVSIENRMGHAVIWEVPNLRAMNKFLKMCKIFSNSERKFLTSKVGGRSQKYFSQRQYFCNFKSFNTLILKNSKLL